MRRVLLSVLLLTTTVFAETIRIHVVDPQSLAVSGARVTVLSGDSVKAIAHTDSAGNADVDVPRGTYHVQILTPNFAATSVEVTVPGEVKTVTLSVAPRS